jgi:DNA repair protein RadC
MKSYAIPHNPGLVVYDAGLKEDPELADLAQQLEDLEKEFVVREIDITFKEKKLFDKTVLSSRDAYRFVRDIIFEGIEVQEHFVVLYTNQSNQIIGYYRHSKGTINSTQVDIQLVLAVALKTLSKGMIISHNHPSGSLQPSDADRRLTRAMKDAAQTFSITLLDHIIATAGGYYSFADSGESSLSGPGDEQPEVGELRARILAALKRVTAANSPALHSMIQTEAGYRKVEEAVMERVLRHRRIPEAIIPQLESEWQGE